MPREPRILFVSHDAYRGGATIFLLNMLKWFKQNTGLHFSVAIREDGQMVEMFKDICDTYILRDLNEAVPAIPAPPKFLSRKWIRQKLMPSRVPPPREYLPDLQALIDSDKFDVLYMNTITMGDHCKNLNLRGIPLITHVHELSMTIRSSARGQESVVVGRSERLICVSAAVADNLIKNFFCPPEKISRISGFVPVETKPSSSHDELKRQLLGPLGIPPDALLIGMCGSGRIHKGVDLAIPLARLMPPDIGGRQLHFIWLGAQTLEYPAHVAVEDSMKSGLAARMHFPGVSKRPEDWISLFDIHALLSREDSFPLVVMEAACYGIPTVCFDGSGGAPEFIRDDAGATVPYLDLLAMAKTLVELLKDDEQRAKLGQTARKRVQSSYTPGVVLPAIYQCISEVFNMALMRSH